MRNLPMTALLAMVLGACATAPKTASGKRDLEASADATIQTMMSKDASIRGVLDASIGYAVFPEIGKGGLIVGGAYGRGVLYEHGHRVGFVEMNQGSVGAQIGAQTYAEVIVFRDRFQVEKLKSGDFSIGAGVSAVVLTTGVAATTQFVDGVAVFTMPRGGVMAELTVQGQKLNYQPKGG